MMLLLVLLSWLLVWCCVCMVCFIGLCGRWVCCLKIWVWWLMVVVFCLCYWNLLINLMCKNCVFNKVRFGLNKCSFIMEKGRVCLISFFLLFNLARKLGWWVVLVWENLFWWIYCCDFMMWRWGVLLLMGRMYVMYSRKVCVYILVWWYRIFFCCIVLCEIIFCMVIWMYWI